MGARKFKQKAPESDRRSIPRVDIRHSDGLQCSVHANSEVLFIGKPYDLSMSSIALVVPNNHVERFFAHDQFEFILEIPDSGNFKFNAKIVAVAALDDLSTRIAFRFDSLPPQNVETKLQENEFTFPPNYGINAFLYKPNFFYERCFVKLVSFSKAELKFSLFDREAILFPEMKIDVYLYEASAQLAPISLKVTSVSQSENKADIVCKILNIPAKLAERVAESLIFEYQLSIEATKKLGLPTPKISDGLKFRFIKTEKEYHDVLHLRFKAYQLAGKVAEGKTHLDMEAPLDHMSRILVAYHGDRIVSSVSISFPSSNDLTLDTERAFVGGYPKKIPAKTDCIEVARLCTDPEYRGSDLLLRVFEHTYKTLQCGGRKYIITSTDNKLWPLYKKLGFKKTGMKYAHPYLAGLEHHVILVHVDSAQTGSAMGPLTWNYLYRDMNDYLDRRSVFENNIFNKIKLTVYRLIGKILKINTKKLP